MSLNHTDTTHSQKSPGRLETHHLHSLGQPLLQHGSDLCRTNSTATVIINKHVAYGTHHMAITILQSEVDFRENNSCDVRADFAEMMSGSTICLSLLCPQKHRHLFHLWSDLILDGHRLGLQVFIEGFLSCWSGRDPGSKYGC